MADRNIAPYFEFYPDDWLESESVFEMGLECEGAYIRLLAAMWKKGGSLPDNDKIICNILRCRPAKWKKIREALVDEFGVIQVSNGRLSNAKLSQVIGDILDVNTASLEQLKG